jgi:tetratricopeptide (TPR) repeat protein
VWITALALAAVAAATPLVLADAATPGAPYQQALQLTNGGRLTDGLAALIKVREVYGDHPDLMTQIGGAQRKLGRLDAAHESYTAALAAKPDHRGALAGLGIVAAARRDFTAARATLERLEAACSFGCAEKEELKVWIGVYAQPSP